MNIFVLFLYCRISENFSFSSLSILKDVWKFLNSLDGNGSVRPKNTFALSLFALGSFALIPSPLTLIIYVRPMSNICFIFGLYVNIFYFMLYSNIFQIRQVRKTFYRLMFHPVLHPITKLVRFFFDVTELLT